MKGGGSGGGGSSGGLRVLPLCRQFSQLLLLISDVDPFLLPSCSVIMEYSDDVGGDIDSRWVVLDVACNKLLYSKLVNVPPPDAPCSKFNLCLLFGHSAFSACVPCLVQNIPQ